MDIKSCLQRAVSDCSPYDPMIHTIFGHHGSHLLAAYDGICSETSKGKSRVSRKPVSDKDKKLGSLDFSTRGIVLSVKQKKKKKKKKKKSSDADQFNFDNILST